MTKKISSSFTGRWNKYEIERFNAAIASGNQCWEEVSELVGTRTKEQCRSHYQKMKISNRLKQAKEKKLKTPVTTTPSSQVSEKQTQFESIETQNLYQLDNSIDEQPKTPITAKPDLFIETDSTYFNDDLEDKLYDFLEF
jgi:Myb-like DNA-binding domain